MLRFNITFYCTVIACLVLCCKLTNSQLYSPHPPQQHPEEGDSKQVQSSSVRCQLDPTSKVHVVGYGAHKNHQNHQQQIKKHRLGDNCKHVYIDGGSNLGVQIRKLFEPKLYDSPKNSVVHRFVENFGANKSEWKQTVCAIGFEPNPAQAPRLRQIAERYTSRGWRTTFIFAGIGDHSSVSTFRPPNDGVIQAAGKVSNKDCIPDMVNDTLGSAMGVNVPVIDFGQFLFNHIKNRHYEGKGKVLAKIDIEGSEYDVMTHLVSLNDGSKLLEQRSPLSSPSSLSAVLIERDEETSSGLNIEDGNVGLSSKPGLNVSGQIVNIVDEFDIEWHAEKLKGHIQMFKSWTSSDFNSKWIRFDDESFKADPHPLPPRLASSSQSMSGNVLNETSSVNDPWSVLNVQKHGAFWRSSDFRLTK